MSTKTQKALAAQAAVEVVSVGTAEVQLYPNSAALADVKQGVLIKAPGPTDDTPNTASVFIGYTGVTADWASTGGFPLAPGESISLPVANVSLWYVISSAASQNVNLILL
jgi:hypothetical protein